MRRALVTGCSSGIGLEVARSLLAAGWEVIGISRTMPTFAHVRFTWAECDVSSPISVHAVARAFLSSADPPLDALVHCAGIRGPYGPMIESFSEAFVTTVHTNLIGTFRVVRSCLPNLTRSPDARILLFSGGGAFSPEPGFSAYAATKGATIAMMETLAVELHGSTVTVNAVAPGFVPTAIHRGTPNEHRASTGQEMAQAVACVRHLLSPDAKGLTGKTVSAGWDPWSEITPQTVDFFNDSDIWTRSRVKAQRAVCPVGAKW